MSNLYLKQPIKVRIEEEMSEGREIGRGVRQGCHLSLTIFNINLKDLMNCFPNKGGVNIGGRRIKCIRFADDMALLAEDERMLKNMLMELNERCEDYGMKINISKTKVMVIAKKSQRYGLKVNSLNKWTISNTWVVISVAT